MYRIVGLVLFLLPALPAVALGDKPKDKPADQYQALVKQYNESRKSFMQAYRTAKTQEERQKAFEKYPRPEQLAPKLLELAKKNPRDPAALDATLWVVINVRTTPKFVGDALGILSKDWATNPKVGRACMALSRSFDKQTEPFLRAVLEKNPSHDAQGAACVALAELFKNLPSLADAIKTRPQIATYYEKQLGKEKVKMLMNLDVAKVNKESEALYERAEKAYADVKINGRTVASIVKPELYEIRHLAIGMKVPDIVGEDLDGKHFKLSDYRGKVVMLDFWGNW